MSYVENIHKAFLSCADQNKAAAMKQYMRNKFEFMGVTSPERKAITRAFWKQNGLPGLKELPAVVEQLWHLPERELQYFAMETCGRLAGKTPESHINTVEFMLKSKQWWDTVDYIAADLAGKHLQRFPALVKDYIPRWQKAPDIWLNRSAILFQLKYKNNTDTVILAESIVKHLDSREFFIQKAIGWALRQYSKVNPAWVKQFIESHELSTLSRREGSKYLDLS